MAVTQGVLDGSGVLQLFNRIRKARLSGHLRVQTGGVRRCVSFKHGQPVFASSSALEEHMGELLVRAGRIDHAQLREALAASTLERKLGAVLVDRGLLSPSELVWAVRHQASEIILALFQIRAGSYDFEPAELTPGQVLNLNLKPPELLAEARRRAAEHSSGDDLAVLSDLAWAERATSMG